MRQPVPQRAEFAELATVTRGPMYAGETSTGATGFDVGCEP